MTILAIVTLAGCSSADAGPVGERLRGQVEHVSDPLDSITDLPVFGTEPETAPTQQVLDEAVQKIVLQHGAELCEALVNYPDTAMSDIIATAVDRYTLEGVSTDTQLGMARQAFVLSAMTYCPDQLERVTTG